MVGSPRTAQLVIAQVMKKLSLVQHHLVLLQQLLPVVQSTTVAWSAEIIAPWLVSFLLLVVVTVTDIAAAL